MLSESHISIHTFPERQYIALDIYTCREYPNNQVYNKIYDNLVEIFEATKEEPLIIDRKF
jgi:S-adenosylmethionine decarboxylase